jgi:gamma-glutamylcyclotransferase (GGCT)/AIG2-like uncharacterized protein YtfP
MTKKVIFFTYGTLLSNLHNHYLLEETKFLGEHKTEPEYTMHSLGGFPCVKLEGTTSIVGELYETDDEDIINSINSLEGFHSKGFKYNWYDVEEIETPYGNAHMFVMLGDKYSDAPVIESGDWKKR